MTTDAATEAWFADELANYKQTFDRGDYYGFTAALSLCRDNNKPLPKWVWDIVIQQAMDAFNQGNTGPGRHGNWRAKLKGTLIDQRRHSMVERHLRARHRQGRNYVSELAVDCGYGKPTPGGANIVTRDDIFAFVSKELRGEPERGSPENIEESYNRFKSGRVRKRPKRPAK
jgi:hypothetical protein